MCRIPVLSHLSLGPHKYRTGAAHLEQLDQADDGAYGKHKHATKLDDNPLLQQLQAVLQVVLRDELGGSIARRLDYRLCLFRRKARSYQALDEIVRVEDESGHTRSIAEPRVVSAQFER